MVCHGISGVVNLARAKSGAFDNIYSLLKKKKNKTRAMLAAKVTPENGVKQQYV